MENEVNNRLTEEIMRQLDLLEDLDPGSEEYTRMCESIAKLYKARVDEIDKDQIAVQNEQHFQETNKLEKKKAKDANRNQAIGWLIGIGTAAATFAAKAAYSEHQAKRMYRFEETGTISSKQSKDDYKRSSDNFNPY